jgi:integrase
MAVYLRGSCKRKHKHTGACQTWYYKFTIRGTTYKRSIPEAQTRKQAEQVERQARQDVFDGTYGRAAGTESFTKFVREVFLVWSREHKRSFRHDELFSEVACAFFAGKAFRDISPLLVEKFKQHRRSGITSHKQQRSAATVNRELAQLSKVFSLAVDYGYWTQNPCRKVKRFSVYNQRERVITDDEETLLFEAFTGALARYRPIAQLALYTGLRLGEITGLRWACVDFDAGTIYVAPETSKTRRARTLPMHKLARAALLELKERTGARERVLDAPGFGKAKIGYHFRQAADSVGLPDVTMHTLRHSFATRLKDAGVDPFTVRDLLGHVTLKMTNYYTHATAETMRRGVESLGLAETESARIVPKRAKASA